MGLGVGRGKGETHYSETFLDWECDYPQSRHWLLLDWEYGFYVVDEKVPAVARPRFRK